MGRIGHTQRQWEAKFFQCGCSCIYCGKPLTLRDATKDHLVPISRGGSDEIFNIGPACFPCNTQKGKRTMDEFLRDRPAFSAHAKNCTAITKPLEQAAALAGRRMPVEVKPSRPRPNPESADHQRILRHMTDNLKQVSWAWRNPA